MKIFGLSFGSSSKKKLIDELNGYYQFAKGHPDDSRVHLRIAEVLMKLGKKGKAMEEYMYAAKGYEANNLSQISAAIYKQILQIDPSQINVYQTLVDVHLKEGFLGDAIATYEKLASYYYNQGMRDEAIETLEKMVAVDPDSLYIKKKVDIFCSERQFESQDEETKTTDEDWELYDPIACSKQQGQQPLAEKRGEFYDLEAALQDDFITEEDKPQKLEGIGNSNHTSKLGFDEIFKEIQHYESENPKQDDSLFHYNLGIAFQKVGRFDEAIDEIKKALDDSKRSADCYLRLAVCSREKNLMDDALKYLKKGLSDKNLSKSKMIELQYEMALVYKKVGKKKKALKIFKNIHEINGTFREVEKELHEASR